MTDIQSISSGLQLAEDGIWHSKDSEHLSYPEEGNDMCFSVEDDSFWFRHRNDCIISIINSYPPENNETIFDIGGGNGYVALGLEDAGFDVVLLEPGVKGCTHAKNRGIKNVICATTTTAGFKRHSLSAVGLFDIIEHIPDDLAFLQSVRNFMVKGGVIYMTVPSYSFLWSDEDEFAGHFRRYTLQSISDVVKSAGFEIEFSSYFFRFLPLPILLIRTIPYRLRLSGKTGGVNSVPRNHSVKNGITRRILDYFLQQEICNLNNRQSMMFGGSCLLVAKCV